MIEDQESTISVIGLRVVEFVIVDGDGGLSFFDHADKFYRCSLIQNARESLLQEFLVWAPACCGAKELLHGSVRTWLATTRQRQRQHQSTLGGSSSPIDNHLFLLLSDGSSQESFLRTMRCVPPLQTALICHSCHCSVPRPAVRCAVRWPPPSRHGLST